MKAILSSALLIAAILCHANAHDHIEVGRNPSNPNQLFLSGPTTQVALLVLRGEPFSTYLPQFPGGYFANELTFSSEVNAIPSADGSQARIEFLSVQGPVGGSFSFWEVGATTPTVTRNASWTSSGADRPAFVVYEDETGYGHIHGRAFTFNEPGTYQVSLRAVDDAGVRSPSPAMVITFQVLATPPLSISVSGTTVQLGFQSRADSVYEIQTTTNLTSGAWTTIGSPLDGTGGTITSSDPLNNRPRVFYRLIEYR